MIEVLTKAGAAVTFNADPYYVASRDWGGVERAIAELGGPGIDIAAVGAVDTSSWRRVSYVIDVTGTSQDDCLANKSALLACLPDAAIGETAALTIGATGSAYTGSLTVLGVVGIIEMPYDLRHDVGWVATVAFTLVCQAPVYGATEALYTAQALTIPAVLDLSAMTGDMAAPLDMLFDATTANLHQLVVGHYADAPQAITKFVHKAVDLTWSGGAADTDAAGYPAGGVSVWKTNAAAGAYTDLDVTDYLGGTYALYTNAKRDAGASPATIETPYTDPVTIEGTDLRRQLIGIVSLPCASVRSAARSTIRVTMKSDDTDYVYCNTLEVVPWPFVGWHHGTAGSSADTLEFDEGLVYADDVASLAYSIDPTALLALGGTLVITGEGTTEAPTLAVEATVLHTPRWEQLPGSGADGGYGPSMEVMPS